MVIGDKLGIWNKRNKRWKMFMVKGLGFRARSSIPIGVLSEILALPGLGVKIQNDKRRIDMGFRDWYGENQSSM